MDTDFAFEKLAELIEAIRESEKLTQWFGTLAALEEAERKDSVQSMAKKMSLEDEPEDVVASLWLLANPIVFAAVKRALEEPPEE
jgi:hypothetical protein